MFKTATMDSHVACINARLNELVADTDSSYHSLLQAARYSLLGGGKRLRPLLTIATTEALGAPADHALDPACAIEMVHAYSLIHDDLPCMDDDDFRRGKPTLHHVYPEGHAVLAGDFLLTYAFEVLAIAPCLSDSQRVQLVATLARAAGGSGMVAGQIMDLEAEDRAIDLESLQNIHRHKTGALLTAPLQFGGIIARVDSVILEQLTLLGGLLGQAFQIVDDILDIVASETKHGKSVSSDVINAKTTYVSLLGLEQSQQKADELLVQSMDIISQLPGNTDTLRALAHQLVHRSS